MFLLRWVDFVVYLLLQFILPSCSHTFAFLLLHIPSLHYISSCSSCHFTRTRVFCTVYSSCCSVRSFVATFIVICYSCSPVTCHLYFCLVTTLYLLLHLIYSTIFTCCYICCCHTTVLFYLHRIFTLFAFSYLFSYLRYLHLYSSSIYTPTCYYLFVCILRYVPYILHYLLYC